MVRKIGEFEKSGVKLQCLTEEEKRLLVRVIRRFEKLKVGEIGIPLYFMINVLKVKHLFSYIAYHKEQFISYLGSSLPRHKITRLVTVTSWCTQPGPNNRWLLEWIIKPLFLNGVIKDMATMEKMLESSDPDILNYTIVRPCRLLVGT